MPVHLDAAHAEHAHHSARPHRCDGVSLRDQLGRRRGHQPHGDFPRLSRRRELPQPDPGGGANKNRTCDLILIRDAL